MGGRRTLHATWLGRVPYAEATALQERVRQALRAGEGPERLLLLEHPPVYTLGRRGSAADIRMPEQWLAARGISVHECDRGGQVTYHGPGQLVGYPIVDLDPDRRDLRRYVRDLQEILVRTLADFGVEAEGRGEQDLIGVWSDRAKVASIGVHVSRWITTHGFALNVTTDLADFDGIVACGLPGVRMASIETLSGKRPELPEVAAVCARHFGDVFDRQVVEAGPPSELQWAFAS
ncbi:MAG: lipoyl(octanoyl) transferase LipB [Thermoanaerobaculia bacterium]